MKKRPEKVLVLGSGAIKIGQAGEFDYSGSQAMKALKEEGIETIVVNPNIATVQTSEHLADKVYFLPVTPDFVRGIIEKERPDGILLGFGGQTALNTGVELHRSGDLKRFGVEVLGTQVEAILDTEDRERFVKVLDGIGMKTPVSKAVSTVDKAVHAADEIGYPVMCRIAYALGGLGSGIVRNKKELVNLVTKAFSHTGQVLVEECLLGWKELEYEVVRDHEDNCIVICSMENIDPMGIHTGESVVVAPVQTLTAAEHYMLRSISVEVIRKLGIVGECNIQFALDPESGDYRIIEVNARLSRSSALASKATGYPLAFIAAKLSVGRTLTELKNSVTGGTSACFEPALDYIVLKFPRWDLQKFSMVDPVLGSEMKSVGEVMAIGRSFEEVIQKAIRMLETGMDGLVGNDIEFDDLEAEMTRPTDKRLFAISEALDQGYTVERISSLTGVDPWFLHRMKSVVDTAAAMKKSTGTKKTLPKQLLLEAKQKGFSDRQIATLTGVSEMSVRKRRIKSGIVPVVKQIDTTAAEYPAVTNYLYLTYNGDTDDISFGGRHRTAVIGGGPYRIGSSVEFDWCCVNSVLALGRQGAGTIMINCNPETVSTDYDICERLYFEELSLERILDIFDKETPEGVIVSMGGQIPNNLAVPLAAAGIRILGTSPESIDRAENRHRFSALLDELGVDQPRWKELTSLDEAEAFASEVGYPVLIRPSYVLSGAAMSTALTRKELRLYLKKASEVSPDHPIVISKFLTGAKEIEMDAVARDGELFCYAISEHVENAGVHSGDATLVLPPQRTYLETMRRVKLISRRIAKALEITGPFNIQFLAKGNDVKVIECNLRASRSLPFVSKVLKIDFVDIAVRIMMGMEVEPIDKSSFDLDYVGVKAPQFSFTRLKGSDPVLGVEMASTGEVACLGDDFNEAFLKSLISVGFRIPRKGILLSTGPPGKKGQFLESARMLAELGYKFYATAGTARFMKDLGFKVKELYWPSEGKEPNTLTYIAKGKIDLVINIPKNTEKKELDNDYLIRRKAVDFDVPLITDFQLAKRLAEALYRIGPGGLSVKSWDEYV
ncbi:MAG: carbamoyl-phosphate synthase (glutamine-hydrolyzing) large subunit [Candidatus Krumholzibacteria bacterium]|nr:carbamoyl-phosphate synthase (glutamine-hydrolyzing) large subunit [Candidatus Krumholzibacteria bacterium]